MKEDLTRIKENKRGKFIMWVCLCLAVIGGVLAVIHATGSSSKHQLEAGTMVELGNQFSGLYNIAYIILLSFMAVTICSIAIFVITKMISDFGDKPQNGVVPEPTKVYASKGAKTSLFGVILMVIVVFLAFIISKGNDVPQRLLTDNNLQESASRWIGAACYTVYALVIVAVLAIVYTEVAKGFKKK